MAAGKYKISSEQYRTVPPAWAPEELLRRHHQLGGRADIATQPRLAIDERGRTDYRNLWYNLADGIRAGDEACIELAVAFIEARVIVSYSGFARQRLAKALYRAPLSKSQQRRLSAHFLALLEAGDKCEEFSAYLRLWPLVITAADRKRAFELLSAQPSSRFGASLIQRLLFALPGFTSNRAETGHRPTEVHRRRQRYVEAALQRAKQETDLFGKAYREALHRKADLIGLKGVIQAYVKVSGDTLAIENTERDVEQAAKDLVLAKENLQHARVKLAMLKSRLSTR